MKPRQLPSGEWLPAQSRPVLTEPTPRRAGFEDGLLEEVEFSGAICAWGVGTLGVSLPGDQESCIQA